MRVSSGVPGFDALVQGGFPSGAAVVVQGPVGGEKDAFLLQFVADGLRRGAAALVILSSVSPAKYIADLRDVGVDVEAVLRENRLRFVDWFAYKEEAVQDVEADGPTFRASIDLANVGIAISRAIAALPRDGEKCAAVEILSPALSVYDLPNVYGFAQSTKAKLERFRFTSLFVLEKEMHDERTLSSLHQPFDGVVDIERVREGDAIVRKVAVLSLKGTSAQSKYVPLDLGTDRVLRVSAVSERERTLHKQEELIRSNPKDPKIWLATARNLNAMGEHDRALKCVEAAIGLDGSDAETWRLKGEVLEKLGRKDEAKDAHAKASGQPVPRPKKDDAGTRILAVVGPRLQENPRDADALFAKAAAQSNLGALRDAIGTLETLATVDDAYPGLWVLKAKLHARIGEREKAQECRLRAQQVDAKEERVARERDSRRLPPVAPPASAFECPECGASVLDSDAVCPSCGVVFEGVEEAPVRKTPPPPPPKPKPDVSRRGLTNGLAREKPKGTGRTNGLVNGTRGRTNGLVNGTRATTGLVNGTGGRTNGLVNGLRSVRSGLTNGLTNADGMTNGLGTPHFRTEARQGRRKLYLIPLVCAVLLMLPLLEPVKFDSGPRITIDGNASDWDPATLIAQGPAYGMNPNVDIVRFGVTDNGDALAFLIAVNGSALRGGDTPPTVDRFDIFLDTDRVASTGYRVDGIGADRMIEINGWHGSVTGSSVFEWDSNRDGYDWRGWIKGTGASAAAVANRIEAEAGWAALLPNKAPVYATAHAEGYDGSMDTADEVLNSGGAALLVNQEPVVAETVTGTNVQLLRFDLTAFGGAAQVQGVTVTLSGSAPLTAVNGVQLLDGAGGLLDSRVPVDRRVSFQLASLRVAPGSPLRLLVVADLGTAVGSTIGALVAGSSDVTASGVAVTVRRLPSPRDVGYLDSIPTDPRIDGGFAEWSSATTDARGDVAGGFDPSIDLTGFDARGKGNQSLFSTRVDGRLLGGSWVPEANVGTPANGTQPPPDTDRDGVPDGVDDPFPYDFNNDGVPDAQTSGDYDGDGITDYGQPGGTDMWLNTTIPASFPTPYAGRPVHVYIGPVVRPFSSRDDILRVFVDVDNTTWSGYSVGGLGADRMIEVAGTEGLVRSAGLFAFNGGYPGEWSWRQVGNASFALGYNRTEFAVPENVTQAGSRVYVEIANSLHAEDSMDAGTRGTRGGGSMPSDLYPTAPSSFDAAPSPFPASAPWFRPSAGTRGTLIDANSNVVTTLYNHQRKVVRAGDAPSQTACDASNSDGCWYVVFQDQLTEDSPDTAPGTETITTGSKVAGTFPADVSTANAVYIQYRESTDAVEAEIAYRSNTGTNTVNSPKNRTWDGSSWGSENEQSTSGSPIRAIRTAWSRTASQTRIIVTLSDDGYLDAYVCTSSCSVTNNIGQVWSTAPTTVERPFDVAYESTSGDGLLVYGVLSTSGTQDIGYKTYSGGSWSSEQYIDDTGHAGDIQYTFIGLASKKASDSVGLIGGDDTDDDANAWIWDGSSWGSNTEITATMESPQYEEAGIAWESSSGDLLAVAQVAGSNDIISKEFTTSWSATSTFTCADNAPISRWLRLKSNPLSTANDMVMSIGEADNDLHTCYWDGSAWTNWNLHDAGIDAVDTRSFDFAWADVGSKGLLVYGTTAGQITYRTFTAPNTWGGATSVTMGTNTHAWVQLSTNPFPRTGGIKILGAVMENTALDLGAVKWDESMFTVIGASTFTADTGTTAYESFHLRHHAANDDQLSVRYDYSSVPSGDVYTLKVKGYREDENVLVQVLTSPSTWNTRITISATSNTQYTYTMTTAEYNSGSPSIRFVDASGGVGMQSDVWVDYAVVTTTSWWDRIILMRSADTSGSSWGSQIVLASGRTGDSALLYAYDSAEPSIAMDSGGYLHVVWASASATGNQQIFNRIRYTKTTVAYATQSQLANAANWQSVTTVDDASTGFMPTVSVDTNNNPHIAWSGSKTSGTVYYKNKAGGTWQSTVSWGTTYTGLSVDVSPQNNYVSLARYYEAGTNEIQYMVCKDLSSSACDASGEFTKWDGTAGVDTVASGVETASYPSLATTYEANGDLWVAYAKDVDGSTRAIYTRFLNYPSAGWATAETVDSLTNVVFTKPSIGIDKLNYVHALYVSSTATQVYYRSRYGGSWGSDRAPSTETITMGSKVSGTFAADVAIDDASYIRYRETTAFSDKVGAFNIGTGAVSTTVPVTGVGFQPKAIIFWWSGRTESTDTTGGANHARGFGVAVSSTSRRAIYSQSQDGVSTSSANTGHHNANVVGALTTTGTIDGLADLQSMDSGGFTLVITDQFTINLRVHYLALGGADLTDAAIGTFTEPAAIGTQDITTAGFQPDAVVLLSAMIAADPPGTAADSTMMIGTAAGATPSNAVWAGAADDNGGTSRTLSYSRSGESIAMFKNTIDQTTGRAQVTQWLSNGFRLDWSERAGARRISYLALKGGYYSVGNVQTQTDTTTTIVASGFGFTPKAAMLVSDLAAANAADVVVATDGWSLGAFTSTTERGAQATRDVDNLATTQVTTGVEHDEAYLRPSASDTVDGLMDIQSMDTDGFTAIMDDADPTQAFVWYLAFGGLATMDIKYDWTSVPGGGSYTLKVKGYRVDENILVQVLTPPATWNTRITISATSNTLYTYSLTSSEYNSGAPSVRFLDASPTDGPVSDVFIDLAIVASGNSRLAIDSSTNNPTVPVRAPNDPTYGTDFAGVSWKPSTSETYFHYIPEFEALAIPLGGILLLGLLLRRRGARLSTRRRQKTVGEAGGIPPIPAASRQEWPGR